MNHSNKISPEGRSFKFNFSKRGAGPLPSPSPSFPIAVAGKLMMTNHNNNINYGLSQFSSSGGGSGGDNARNLNLYNTTTAAVGTGISQNRVPEIQMINKFYGLIPKKFVICERIRPYTVGATAGRQKSTARPKSTKGTSLSLFQDKKLGRPTRQNSSSENDSGDNYEDIFGQNSTTMPSVTTRRISFEKLYRKKPKKAVHSKSMEQNSSNDRDESFSEDGSHLTQRVIRIDLNQMKWEEESHLDDAKSCDGESIILPLTKKSTIRKAISFDENIIERDELQNTYTKKMERPATGVPISRNSTVLPPRSEIENFPIPQPQPITTHWTTGKSTAERRAKLQRSFSVKESSFDGGAESESDYSKYPESLVHSGRKSLHVEGPPEVDTMVSKIRSRNQKVPQDLPMANFELELSRLIIESEAVLSNLGNSGIQMSAQENKKNLSVSTPKSEPVLESKLEVEIPKEVCIVDTPTAESIPTTTVVSDEKPASTLTPATNVVENRLKSLTTVERRKLLKKSVSLPSEKELDGNSSNGSRRTAPLLVRQSSLGGNLNSTSLTGNRAGVSNNGVKSNKIHQQQTHGRISIKKPLVEITRLRPKTAPTVTVNGNANPAFDRNSKRQPLKARSGVQQVTVTPGTSTGPPKPLPQTKGPDSPKKVLSWSSYSNMDSSAITKAKSAKNNANKISPVGKDKKASEVVTVRHQENNQEGTGTEVDDNEAPSEPRPTNRSTLTRRSFSLDEGALLFYSNSEELNDSSNTYTSAVEASLQDSKKREQCVKIYEKMLKVGCAVRLQTILRGLMTPSEYRKFITAATAAEEKAAAELEAEATLDAGVLEAKLKPEISIPIKTTVQVSRK